MAVVAKRVADWASWFRVVVGMSRESAGFGGRLTGADWWCVETCFCAGIDGKAVKYRMFSGKGQGSVLELCYS